MKSVKLNVLFLDRKKRTFRKEMIECEETIIKNILDDIIIKIEDDNNNNVDILKLNIKTLEYKIKLANEENFNLNKLFEAYKKDREESYEKVIKVLNEKLAEKDKELISYDLKLNEIEAQKQQQIDQLHLDFKNKFESAFKKFQEMQKDKTSMVMKYAEAEKKSLDLNRTNEHLQTRLNDFLKEKQRLIEKLEVKNQEKSKFNTEYELKLTEISNLNKQIEKLKEINVLNEIKLNKFESKYKNECETNIENKKLIETLNIQLVKLRNSMIKNEEFVEELADSQIIDDNDDNQKYFKLSHDYSQLNTKYKALSEELNQLKVKNNSCENENKANAIQIQTYKDTLNNQKQMNKDLLSEILQLRELQVTLNK